MVRSLLLALLLLSVSPSSLPAADTLAMQQIAILPFRTTGKVPCGDADRDGRREMYLQSPEWYTEVLEHAGGNRFDSTYLDADYANCWVLGDADRDGRSELVLQVGQVLYVYESPDSQSLPHDPVWFDTLLYSAFPMDASTPDLDRDGRPEVACGTDGNWLVYFESVADDSFECIASCSLGPFYTVRGLTAAPDIDRDGRNEVIVLSVHYDLYEGHLRVFESPGDYSFEVVWSAAIPANSWRDQEVDVGDIDGDSMLEIVAANGVNTQVWRCTGNDSFELMALIDSCRAPLTVYDINSDGRTEVICRKSRYWTAIYEYLPVGIQERALERLELETSARL